MQRSQQTDFSSSSTSISDDVPTDTSSTPLAPSTPQKLDITYTHHHILSFNTATPSSDNTLADQIKALKLSIVSSQPDTLLASDDVRNDSASSEAALLMKTITIDGISIQYNATNLPEPPVLSYKVNQLEKLLYDWDHSSKIMINGVGISICHWKKMYSWTRPKAWKQIKDQWTKYKFIVGALKFHGGIEGMVDYLTSRTSARLGSPKLTTMTGISDALRKARNIRNKNDAAKARKEYDMDEFNELFSYKKGGKKHVMKREQDIARFYRKVRDNEAYWDEDGERASEDEIEID